MANITAASKAAGVGVGIENTVLSTSASVMKRKILIMAMQAGKYEDAVPLGKVQLVTSGEDAAVKTGAGTMAHRLSAAAFRGSKNSVTTYLLLQKEPENAKAAAGEICIEAVGEHGEGAVYLYIGGQQYNIPVIKEETEEEIALKIMRAINDDSFCPVTSEQNGAAVSLVSKSKGEWGNGITVKINQRTARGETLPDGIVCTISEMSGGCGIPDIKEGIKQALGSGDSSNEEGFTAIIHGYGKDTQVLDALSKYTGEGNELSGLYSQTIGRPVRSIVGETGTDFQSLLEYAGTRKNDRCNGICVRPGSLTHPQEIAAELMGAMEEVSGRCAEGSYIGLKLTGADIGVETKESGGDWTSEYANRDLAVRSGLSPLIAKDGIVTVQNVVSFFRPSDIPEDSNMYRRMRDIAITQNVLYNIKSTFSTVKWTGYTVVKDKSNVTNTMSRVKARDSGDIIDDLLALVNSFMSRGWLFDTAFSIQKLKEAGSVTVRPDGGGFNSVLYLVYSGEGAVLDTICYVDASVSIAL